MKFGTVDLADADGAVLAHSVSLGGSRLRKGRVLTHDDLASLASAGYRSVTVARLEEGDVHEDAAAVALAAALVPDPAASCLRLTDGFTGRVNVLATSPGVAVLDVTALEAINRIDPMITVATVPQYRQMQEGGMIATIKIISYGVSGAALEAACAHAAGAIRVAGPVLRSARLIITEVEGGAGEKGAEATAARLEAFDIDMPPPVMVRHDSTALAAALQREASDLTLILTGSATSDAEDVAPAAVRQAGGVVTRFGMPVDPGNLLFTGHLQGRAVIGLPGCARAPALNGADWVMARMICGLEVGDDEISAMGVGGLLKEIPTRPHPRRREKSP